MCQRERNKAKCQEPLTLDEGSQIAFARRQEILLDHPKWPIQNWYNDEDFCRAYNTAVGLQAEVERLRNLLNSRDLAVKAAQGIPRHQSAYTGQSADDGLQEAGWAIQRVYSEAAEAAKGGEQ